MSHKEAEPSSPKNLQVPNGEGNSHLSKVSPPVVEDPSKVQEPPHVKAEKLDEALNKQHGSTKANTQEQASSESPADSDYVDDPEIASQNDSSPNSATFKEQNEIGKTEDSKEQELGAANNPPHSGKGELDPIAQ